MLFHYRASNPHRLYLLSAFCIYLSCRVQSCICVCICSICSRNPPLPTPTPPVYSRSIPRVRIQSKPSQSSPVPPNGAVPTSNNASPASTTHTKYTSVFHTLSYSSCVSLLAWTSTPNAAVTPTAIMPMREKKK